MVPGPMGQLEEWAEPSCASQMWQGPRNPTDSDPYGTSWNSSFSRNTVPSSRTCLRSRLEISGVGRHGCQLRRRWLLSRGPRTSIPVRCTTGVCRQVLRWSRPRWFVWSTDCASQSWCDLIQVVGFDSAVKPAHSQDRENNEQPKSQADEPPTQPDDQVVDEGIVSRTSLGSTAGSTMLDGETDFGSSNPQRHSLASLRPPSVACDGDDAAPSCTCRRPSALPIRRSTDAIALDAIGNHFLVAMQGFALFVLHLTKRV